MTDGASSVWASVRRDEFDHVAPGYLDHALRGPPPRRALAAAQAALEATALGAGAREAQRLAAEQARSGVAGLIGGWPASSVAFPASNTTGAIACLAGSISWKPGDRVVVHADEVPGNILPWRALQGRGVEVTVLPSRGGRLELEDLEAELDRGAVRAVSVAAVALPTGERRDLAAVGRATRARGALLFVDAAQALGCLRLDVSAVDAVVGCGRKWLLGPPDVGILALRPGLEEELEACTAGAGSRGGGAWKQGALRFEGGALPAIALAGLASSVELLTELGLDAIQAGVLGAAQAAAEAAEAAGLAVTSPRGAARSGIVWVELPAGVDPDRLRTRLAAAAVTARVDGRRMRLAGHGWSDRSVIEMAVAAASGR